METCPGPQMESNKENSKFFQSKGMKILHQNIRGLLSNLSALQEFFDRHKNIDIMTLSETHINTDTACISLYNIPGYTFIKRDRQQGKGGGVAMYIKEGINFERRFDLEDMGAEIIVIEVFLQKAKSFLITSLYRPPDSSKHLSHKFNDIFDTLLSLMTAESKEVILLGDLNVNYLKADENR